MTAGLLFIAPEFERAAQSPKALGKTADQEREFVQECDHERVMRDWPGRQT